MNINLCFCRALAVIAVVTTLSASAPAARGTSGPPADAEIQALLKSRLLTGTGTGFVVGILESGTRRVVTAVADGAADPPSLNGDTVFEIGSVTKVFTASVLASMVERREVALQDPVKKCLPGSVRMPTRGGRDITLLDLATHTSGLPRVPANLLPKDNMNPYGDYSAEKLYQFLSAYELPRDVGAQYEYSNLGMGLLGHALARCAGTDYETLVVERILKPLGMNDTRITLTPDMRARFVSGHDQSGAPTANWDLNVLAGAGGLHSTVNDLLRFVAATLDANSPLVGIVQRTHAALRDTTIPQTRIGLAWHIRRVGDRDIVWHNGGTGGFHAFVGIDPRAQTAVVMLHNGAAGHDDVAFHLLEPGLPLAERAPAPKVRTSIAVPASLLDRYTGEYIVTPAVTFTVTREGDALFLEVTGQPKARMYAESETSFFLTVVDAQIRFVREGEHITGLVLHQNGRDVPASARQK